MKKPVTKWVIVAILILLIAYSGFATYNWLQAERIENRTLNDAIDLSDIPLLELSAMGFEAEYLIRPDATDELLRATITQYLFRTMTLSHSSRILHTLTDDERYQIFTAAMINLRSFFLVAVANDRPDYMKEILTTNLDTLKQMGDTLEEILRIDNLALADAEKLLELSGNLTVG